jgi:hypothetical protein
MKACMREISKWCREVAREPGEEDAEEKDANAAMKVCFFSFNVSFWLPRKFEKMKKKRKETCVFMSFNLSRENENFTAIESVAEKCARFLFLVGNFFLSI